MDLASLFKSKKTRKPAASSAEMTFRERLSEDPLTGWVVILAVSAFVALALIGRAAWLFYQIDTGAIRPEGPAASAGHPSFDRASFDKLIGAFDRRAAEYSALKRGYDGPSDPSK